MDSVSQATLGAAVGHLCWHDKIGRKAIIAGALLGTLPDLDVLIYPFLDEVQQLYWHRGESHSIWFTVLGATGFSWLFSRLSWTRELGRYRAGLGIFLIFSTHILIDLFNVYGTQLLAPVSRHGFAINNMFIIDPLFTVPLLFGTISAYFWKQEKHGIVINQTCIIIAALYATWSLWAQYVAELKFSSALAEKQVSSSRQITSAGPFTTLLWRHVAETPDGYLLAYWSWLDDDKKPIRFQLLPRNEAAVNKIRETRTFKAVDWFSKGWWLVAENSEDSARVVDVRFGEIPSADNQPLKQWSWPFAWKFHRAPEQETALTAVRPTVAEPGAAFTLLFKRISGHGNWLSGPEDRE